MIWNKISETNNDHTSKLWKDAFSKSFSIHKTKYNGPVQMKEDVLHSYCSIRWKCLHYSPNTPHEFKMPSASNKPMHAPIKGRLVLCAASEPQPQNTLSIFIACCGSWQYSSNVHWQQTKTINATIPVNSNAIMIICFEHTFFLFEGVKNEIEYY